MKKTGEEKKAIAEAEHTLREYMRERSDYKRGKAARGLYTYLTSTVR